MWAISTGNTAGASGSAVSNVLAVLQDAADYWGRYIDFGGATLEVTVNIITLDPDALAQAGTSFSGFGAGPFQADTILELQTGFDQNGSESDIEIDVNLSSILNNEFFFGGVNGAGPPPNLFDLFTVLVHEIGHGLGFLSLLDIGEQAVFDTFLSPPPPPLSGSLEFTGSNAAAVLGRPVSMDSDPSHVSPVLAFSIMTPALGPGERILLSNLDVAILQDIGLPVLAPTLGDDVLFGFPQDDLSVDLLDGNDRFEALGGNDNISGGAGDDTILGEAGADMLDGGPGADLLFGGSGIDGLFGSDGDDTLEGGADGDFLSGGVGSDTASYVGSASGVSVNLSTQSGAGGDAAGDTPANIENLTGSNFVDTLIGDAGANVLSGGAGADQLFGDAGDDTLVGDVGDDTLNGEADDDLLVGDAGDDRLFGGDGADQVFAGFGDDRADGGAGNDLIRSGPGKDTLLGGDGNDTLGASNRGDLLRGEGGDDLMLGSNGNDRLFGGDGADTLLGGNGRDTLSGDAGADRLNGGNQIDTASYDAAGAAVAVSLTTGTGSAGEALGDVLIDIENLEGSAFADTLDGSDGANRLAGGAGNDAIDGLGGNDQIIGGAGDDTLAGGTGSDTFLFFSNAPGADRIADFTPGAGTDDAIRLLGFGAAFDTFAEVQAAASQVGADTMIDFGGGNSITLEGVAVASLDADDFLFG